MNIEQDINILKQLIREYKRKTETQNEFFIGLIEERALKKLYQLISKENKMKFEEVGKYIDSIWWTCGDVIKIEED